MLIMGDRVGILGLNRAGKSTLIKLLVDETRTTLGHRDHSPTPGAGALLLAALGQGAAEPSDVPSLGSTDPSLLTHEVDGRFDGRRASRTPRCAGPAGARHLRRAPDQSADRSLVRCELARLF